MRVIFVGSAVAEPLAARSYRLLALGGIAAAALLAVMSFAGIRDTATYAREAEPWRDQAIAQDWFDLAVAVPAPIGTALWAGRGTRRALLTFGGVLLFTVYTATIYAFAVRFNALFLVYCAALGVGIYTLIGTIARLWQVRDDLQVNIVIPHRTAGAFLVAVGATFAGLWLLQLVPALRAGSVPAELAAMGLATNPVHVIDLSFILPLHVLAGFALWRLRTQLALLAPIVLVFGALMAASIATLAAYTGGMVVMFVMAGVALLSSAFAALVIRGMR